MRVDACSALPNPSLALPLSLAFPLTRPLFPRDAAPPLLGESAAPPAPPAGRIGLWPRLRPEADVPRCTPDRRERCAPDGYRDSPQHMARRLAVPQSEPPEARA